MTAVAPSAATPTAPHTSSPSTPGPTKARASFSSAKSARSILSVLSSKSTKSASSSPTAPSSPAVPSSISNGHASPMGVEGGGTARVVKAAADDGNAKERVEEGGSSVNQGSTEASTPSPKPSKKSTVDELRTALEDFGLDTKGKKDTLFKRLLHAFRRAQTSVSTSTQTDPLSTDPNSPARAVFDTAGPSRVNPYLNYNPQGLSPKALGKQPCRAFLCFDVEATCRGGKEFSWPNEIIEFPVVLVKWDEDDVEEHVETSGPAETATNGSSADPFVGTNGQEGNAEAGPSRLPADLATTRVPKRRTLKIVDTFHSYVRPVWSTELSEFCVKFTGITQEMVDISPTFPEVLRQLKEWLKKHDLLDEDGEGLKNAMWVTDGPWDLRDFIPKQLHITPTNPSYPLYLRQPYLNIKQAFQTVLSEEYRRKGYAADHPGVAPNARALSRITTGKLVGKDGQERLKGLGFYSTITGMIEKLELGAFEGRQHCGLDDATNVARILIALSEKDVLFEANAKLPHANGRKKWPWMGAPGEVNWEEWMSDAKTPPLATTVEPLPSGTALPEPTAKDGSTDHAVATSTATPPSNATPVTEIEPQNGLTAPSLSLGPAIPISVNDASGESSISEPKAATEGPAVSQIKVMEDQAGPLAKPPPEDVEVEQIARKLDQVAVA